MSKFPFKAVTFDDDDLVTSGASMFTDADSGVASEEAAIEMAEMFGAKVVGIYEVVTGKHKLVPVNGEVSPRIQEIWNGMITSLTENV